MLFRETSIAKFMQDLHIMVFTVTFSDYRFEKWCHHYCTNDKYCHLKAAWFSVHEHTTVQYIYRQY